MIYSIQRLLSTLITTLIMEMQYSAHAAMKGSQEFCLTEAFEASCADGEVIVIDSAKFGRMGLGRCVTKNYGFMGCSADVLNMVDSRCSGRDKCKFGVAEPSVGILNTSPCPKDFSSYLEVSYTCQQVMRCKVTECERNTFLHTSAPSGVLASLTTANLGCGSATCPWVIEVQNGQRINVTLWDFSIAYRNTSHNVRHKPGYPLYCHEYAMIKETEVPRTTTICGGELREKMVYISSTNRIEIHIVTRKSSRNGEHFLLKYDVTGCPTFAAPSNTWTQRTEERMTVRCNTTKETWVLTCVGTEWVGEMRNCTLGQPWTIEEVVAGIGLPSVGVSVLIIFGVALVVVIYIAISIICVLYFRRHRRRSQRRAEAEGQDDMLDGGARQVRPNMDNYEERTPMLLKHVKGCRKSDGDYTDICELQLLNSGLLGGPDNKSPASILKCPGGRTVSLTRDTSLSGKAEPPCCNNTSALSTFRTFKPKDPHNLYECPQANQTGTIGRFRPLARYHELDASMLHNCHGLGHAHLGENASSSCPPPDLHRDIPHREVIPEGLENEANTLKENI